jgi:NAD(P) transhydrogenase subunit alpha
MEIFLNFIQSNIELFYIVVVLSVFLGIEVISRVPSVLHTPLMSGANAIHGVIINKRSIRPGYAGIENQLFFLPNTSMLFGNARDVLQQLIT